MKSINSTQIFVILISLILTLTACQKNEYADMILYNGIIFTANTDTSYVEAIAIKNGKILATGTSIEINKSADTKTKRIDLKGNLVIPGINDAHFHLSPSPEEGSYLTLSEQDPTWKEVTAQTTAIVAKSKANTWIFGSIGGNIILDANANRFSLDKISPNNPVLLFTYFGHGYVMNTKAMINLGISENETDPLGGRYERAGKSQVINGKFHEYANFNLIRQVNERVPDSIAIKQLKVFEGEALKLGITSIQNMAMFSIERFLNIWDKTNNSIRMHTIRFPATSKDSRLIKEGRNLPIVPFKNKAVKVMGTKWILDGTPIERGAAFRKNYADTPNWFGKLNFKETEIELMVQECLDWNDQLLVHCAGDKPVELVFNAMEKKGNAVNWKEKRFRIEHGDGIHEDLLQRAKNLGIVVVQNPSHLTEVAVSHTRYGENSTFFNLKTFIDSGVPLALGSDGPINPYLNIMFAAIHPSRPSEAITREQAVRAYTYGSAYAEFEETTKGTLTVGKVADLAVLSQNIFKIPLNELPKTSSILTMIEGKIVFDSKTLTY